MNGIKAMFMVESVLATNGPAKYNAESRKTDEYVQKRTKDEDIFAQILGTAIKEVR